VSAQLLHQALRLLTCLMVGLATPATQAQPTPAATAPLALSTSAQPLDLATAPGTGEPIDVDVAHPDGHNLTPPATWQRGSPGLRVIGLDGRDSWVRFSLRNSGTQVRDGWVQVSKPFTDMLACTVRTSDGQVQQHQLGDHRPFAERPVNATDFLLPVKLAPQAWAHVSCLIRNDGAVVADVKFWQPQRYLAHADQQAFWRTASYGALLFAIVAAMCMSFLNRSTLTVLLVFDLLPTLAGSVGMEGDAFQHLWPQHPGLNVPPYYWILAGIVAEGLVFKQLIQLNAKERRMLNAMMAFPMLLGIVSVFKLPLHAHVVPLILATSMVFGLTLIGVCLRHWRESPMPKVMLAGLATEVLALYVNAFGLMGIEWLVPASTPFQLASLFAGLAKALMLAAAMGIKAQQDRIARDELHQAYTDELKDKLAFELQFSAMLLKDPSYDAPNQRALEEAVRRQTLATDAPVTVWLIRLNRLTALQSALSVAATDRAVRDGIGKLTRWLRTRTDLALMDVIDQNVVAALSEQLLAFCTLGTPTEAQVKALEAFLVARQEWEGLYLAWDPHVGISTESLASAQAELTAKARIALNRCTPHQRVQVYDCEDKRRELLLQGLTMDIDGAIARGELELHYQPKIKLETLETCSFEALVRWRHPVKGMIPPGAFIAEAEATGAIHKLTLWAIREATRFSLQMAAPQVRIAVNISAFDLATADFVDEVARILAEEQGEASRLILEVTESVAVADTQTSRAALERLRAMGIQIALDDFGTGQSSLAMLEDMPIDELKIDRALVLGIDTCARKKMVLQSSIELGRRLGLTVTVEGVETNTLVNWLLASGCHVVQGFYFSRPLPPVEALAWMARSPRQVLPLGVDADGALHAMPAPPAALVA
jgi:EAL domain-containing protein (putative c-di-GMP-specific phosphodiesterase class I)